MFFPLALWRFFSARTAGNSRPVFGVGVKRFSGFVLLTITNSTSLGVSVLMSKNDKSHPRYWANRKRTNAITATVACRIIEILMNLPENKSSHWERLRVLLLSKKCFLPVAGFVKSSSSSSHAGRVPWRLGLNWLEAVKRGGRLADIIIITLGVISRRTPVDEITIVIVYHCCAF